MTHTFKITTLFSLLFVCMVSSLTVSCQHGSSNQAIPTEVNWADSAFTRLQKSRYYYNNNLHDSLYEQVAHDLKFHREHEQWEYYYYTWWILANDYTFSGHADLALTAVNSMYQDARKRNNSYGLAVASDAMGLAYAFQTNYEEAARCYREALRTYPKDADMTMLNNIYMDYSSALAHLNNYETMNSVHKEWKYFLDTKAVVKDGDDKAQLYANWHFKHHSARFDFHYNLKDYDKATADLDSALHYQSLFGGSTLARLRLLGNRAKLMLAKKEYEQALNACDEMVAQNKGADLSYEVRQLDLKWQALEGLGRYDEALAVHKQHKVLDDSIKMVRSANQLNELNKKFELDELKVENENTRMRAIIMFSLLLLLSLVIFIFFRHHAAVRLEAVNKKLERANIQLEQKNAELTAANERAEESSNMKTNFIRQISHEIRTPLNILSGFTQIITMSDVKLDKNTKEDINRQITENTDRIVGLVGKMLELSDVSSRTVIERTDYVSVAQIAIEAVHSSGISVASHLTFNLQLPPDAEERMLQTNLNAAQRALSLVLDNARKFTAPPQNISYNEVEKNQQASLRVHYNNKSVQFIVEDTGPGIPAKEAEHIFDEFVQLDEYYDGTGIGLTVARSLTRRLGGDITLDISYTTGARFIMTLPSEA